MARGMIRSASEKREPCFAQACRHLSVGGLSWEGTGRVMDVQEHFPEREP